MNEAARPHTAQLAMVQADSARLASQTAAPRVNSSVRIPALDGLRGLAILLVLNWHSVARATFLHYPTVTRILGIERLTWSGVDLFFVLSGFLIGGILLDHRDSPNYFRTFYLRRAYRILPLYFLVVTLCWVVFQLSIRGLTPFGRMNLFPGKLPWWSFFTFTQNLMVAVVGGSSRGGLGVTWSLAIEEQFYLTLPFVIRRVSRKSLGYILLAIICVVPILRGLLIHYWAGGARAAYVLTPCRADTLAMGVLCALLVRSERAWNYLIAHRSWLNWALGIFGACVVAMIVKEVPAYNRALYGLEFSVMAFFYGAVLMVAVIGDNRFFRRVLCNPLLMKLGVIAYGTYLFHYIFIDTARLVLTYHREHASAWAFIGADVLGIALAIGAAILSWRYFEKPLVQRGHAYNF